ncbi:LysR family transcriptional regulator, partial [Salmonella enterica subsp. enterica serovar Javiana]
MQLHQLEYLVAVADEGGFTRAGHRLRVAQPGVSAQIRKLERELGHELLDRSGPRVRPTAVGRGVVAAARAALDAVAGVRRVVRDLDGLLRGEARVGMVTSGPFLDVPGVLADFAAAH